MPSRASKAKLVDVREQRHSPRKIEIREAKNGDLVLTGYASTFDEYEVYGGPENYGWIERIDKRAFDITLSQSPDLHLLINHDGMPLARTKSGTLVLSVDDVGLRVEATLDRSDPDVQALIPKMARGDMDEMSFAFRVKQQQWSAAEGFEDDPMSYRLITELSLQRGDVSVVNFGANPNTHADLATVGAAVQALSSLDPSELRSAAGKFDRREVKRAIARLSKLIGKPAAKRAQRDADEDPAAMLQALDATLDQAVDLAEGIDVEAESEEVGQLVALVNACDALVDQIMDLEGVFDADDDDEAAGANTRQRGIVVRNFAGEPVAVIQREKRATTDEMIQGLHDWASDMGADCRSEDDEDDDDYDPDEDDDRSDEAVLEQKRRKAAAKRGDKLSPAAQKALDERKAKRGPSTIADGLRIEVGGTSDSPVVKLHDASGQLDEVIRARLANEVREAVLGNRGAISKSKPATQQGKTISVSDAGHITGRNERVEELKRALGHDTRRTFSLDDARELATHDTGIPRR